MRKTLPQGLVVPTMPPVALSGNSMTADLEPILRRLADHERIEALAITLREQAAARVHVAPALTAARPAMVAALATLAERPLLYVVGSGDAALRAREDLCQWLDSETVLL